ncbi:hypothetical protein R3W88_033356 [Solanum pinnatisectum]|uniref:Ubiquitin-like protease family profile domain-containing protein n=1 Tax=Solanum pinnatisectum TaxID=50273 RepID=A0AAV9K1J2_9SOLN|nr:hypothetical protein R3W88_033356 [Solanum pinnatisectum]
MLLPLLTSNVLFCLCEQCEKQHDYFISHVKEFTNIFKIMTYNNDVHTSKKISQPLKFYWVLAIVVLKERRIKVYDSMSSSKTNRKLSSDIQKLFSMLPKYLEFNGSFEQKDQTNWSVLESFHGKNKSHPFKVIHVTGIAQEASNSLDCGLFVVAYANFLSDGLKVPSYEIISQTLPMGYASLL